jgi:hypothetical protein
LCDRGSSSSGGSGSSSSSSSDGGGGTFTAAEDKVASSISVEDTLIKRIASFRKRSSINISSDLLKNLR